MNPEVECIETEGTIISLQDYQPESKPASSKETFQAMAVEKIAEELKAFHGGQKEKCVSSHVAAQITHFCEESLEFAEVVYKTKRTLSDCCAEVLKDAKEYASDIDVYRGIVKSYFPNADVRFLMNIEINGAAPSEEEMAKLPEKPAPKAKPAPKPADKAPGHRCASQKERGRTAGNYPAFAVLGGDIMLIKKELQNLPLSPSPAPTKRVPLTAGAAVHQIPRCGDILAVDVYKNRKLLFRFFSDGKNFVTWRERTNVQGWTKRNPFIVDGIRYRPVKAESSSMESVSQVLGIKPRSRDVLEQVEECLALYYKQKKERALEAKYRLMDQHLDMFPVYPSDLDEFCENHVFHKSIVYLSKLIDGQRWGQCMHCGKRFRLDRFAKPGSEGICPKCGFPARFWSEWASKPIVEKAKICIPSRVDGKLLLRYTDVKRSISPHDASPEYDYSDFFLNITEEKNDQRKTYAYWWRKCPYYWSGWSRLRNGSVCFSDTYVYTENLSEIFGKEYCHVDLYAGLKDLRRPIDFVGLLRNLRDIPQAEYLFKLGLPGLAAGLSPLRTYSGSFAELTGVSKQYLPILRETQACESEIRVLAAVKKWVPFEVVRKLCALELDTSGLAIFRGVVEYNGLYRVLRYLEGQKKSKKSFAARLVLYRDYLDMAKRLGCNMKKKAILEPRDLKAQHDLFVAQIKEQKEEIENSLLPQAIENGLYWWAREYASEDFMVVYPQTRNEFISEGQSLNHCVGGANYYDRHILGRQMVFFIRRTSQPEKPFFTTEIDMEAGRILQLYGFSDCSAPKEVRDFVEGFARAVMRWRSAERMAG